jgi:YfiH family protein
VIEFYKYDIINGYEDIIALTTTKNSEYQYDFSQALHTGEDTEAICTNRQALLRDLSLSDYSVVLANQTHSCNIAVINDDSSKGWQDSSSALSDTDALITKQRGVLLGILSADCVPVILYDKTNQAIANIHAGWRGSACAIVSKTIVKMQIEFGSNPADMIAIVAPSIGKCCYEVDESVAKHFSHIDGVCEKVGDKYMLDLPQVNRHQLIQAGVKTSNIQMSGVCTSCENEKFFSYRKECGCSGRFLTLIGLKFK